MKFITRPATAFCYSSFDGTGHFCQPHTVCFPYVRTIASPFRASQGLVSHGVFRLPPCSHFRVQVNYPRFYITDYAVSPPELMVAVGSNDEGGASATTLQSLFVMKTSHFCLPLAILEINNQSTMIKKSGYVKRILHPVA